MKNMWRFFVTDSELAILTPWFMIVLADRAEDFQTHSYWTGYQFCWWPTPAPEGCYEFKKIYERRWNVILRRYI